MLLPRHLTSSASLSGSVVTVLRLREHVVRIKAHGEAGFEVIARITCCCSLICEKAFRCRSSYVPRCHINKPRLSWLKWS